MQKEHLFPLLVPGQAIAEAGQYGACDPDFRDKYHALSTGRPFTVVFSVPRVLGPPPGLVLAAATVKAWTKGQSEPGAEAGWTGNLTFAETDADKDGCLVASGQEFVAVGLGVNAGLPFVVDSAANIIGTRRYPLWLNVYRERIQAAVLSNLVIEVQLGTTSSCKYQLGPAADLYPPQAGVHAREAWASNGWAQPAQFVPFRVGLISGGQNDANKIQLQVQVTNPVQVEDDPLTPSVMDAFVPVRIVLYGWPRCLRPTEAACDRGVGSEQVKQMQGEVDDLRAAQLTTNKLLAAMAKKLGAE